nr:hypothetical protein [Tanacetum cinerariifolium]
MAHHKEIFDTLSLTKKVFANNKRVGILQTDEQSLPITTEPSTSKPQKKHKPKRKPTHESETEVIDIKSTYQERIEKLKGRIERLEEENRVLKELKREGIANIDANVEINLDKAQAEAYNLDLDHQEKVLSMMDLNEEEPADVEEVLERRGVIIQDPKETTTTATVQPKVQAKDKGKAILIKEPKPLKSQAQIKLDEEVARQLQAELNADINWNDVIEQVKRNERLNDARRGVIIQEPEETTTTTNVQPNVQAKEKGKAILIEEPKPLKRQVQIKLDEEVARQLQAELNADINWNDVIEQVKRNERLNDTIMKYQTLKRKPLTQAQARRNMIVYLKNMAGFKMDYFKGMTYDEIRPLFENHYNYNQTFLDEEVLVRSGDGEGDGEESGKAVACIGGGVGEI